jgi:predicted ABC-type ATPase
MGYRAKLFFLCLASPELAIARVRQRVQTGGHDVPESVIRHRFQAGWLYFSGLYRQIVDEWPFYDNSGPIPQLLEEGVNP